jgi:uncharacterized protein (TIGR03435 family)
MLRYCLSAALFCAAALAQTPATLPEFEVASIKPSGNILERVNVGLKIDGAQVHAAQMSVKDYIQMAYKVKFYQVDGPDWMASARFDLDAKIPDGVPSDKIPEMLQSLLATRFGLKMHRGTKDYPVYALTVASDGVKMTSTPDNDPSFDDCRKGVNVKVDGGRGGVNANYGCGAFFRFGDNKLVGKRLAMQYFADILGRFTDRPIVDQTNLKDRYDFELALSTEDYYAMLIRSAVNAGVTLPPEAMRLMNNSDDTLMMALRRLGLKLEQKKAPIETVVVDEIRKTPSEN